MGKVVYNGIKVYLEISTEKRMNFEITSSLSPEKHAEWEKLIESVGLMANEYVERTVLIYDGEELVATGSRDGYVLKLIAVSDSHRGEDLTARLLTELRRDAFEAGYQHLFLYTKPENRYTFESLFFYPVAQTDRVLVMESVRGGFESYLRSLPEAPSGTVGAVIMNCNPFTLGHRALIEQAARECSHVFVFVLSEDRSEFSSKDRLEMVRLGVADMENVTVLQTGPYLISTATFPTYFIKDRDLAGGAACDVDIEIFSKHLAPRLNITKRYVGTEPYSPLTALYNKRLEEKLEKTDISLVEIERVCSNGEPISASRVRESIKKGDTGALLELLPETTLNYIQSKDLKGN